MFRKLTLWLFLAPFAVSGQILPYGPWSVCVTNTATMLPPASLTAVVLQPLHPGVSAAYEFGWRKHEYYKWFQDAGISYSYHRFVSQAVVLSTRAGYRRSLGALSFEASLLAGYMHMFLLTERAVQRPDGTWEPKRGFGRPQFITGAGLGAGWDIGDEDTVRRIILNYDFRLQMPFVKSYVPLLPSGLLSLGVQFTL